MRIPGQRTAVVTACLVPAGMLLVGALTGRLGANPVEMLTNETGEWTLRLLLLVLAATPLRRLTGWRFLLVHRRVIGLACFSYGVFHLLTYLWLDQAWGWRWILADLLERPFIMVGMAALGLLAPLAVTSWDGAVRWLGWHRWQRLHRLVYLAAGLGVLHFWWLVKADIREPLIYTLILAVLFGLRLYERRPGGAR